MKPMLEVIFKPLIQHVICAVYIKILSIYVLTLISACFGVSTAIESALQWPQPLNEMQRIICLTPV